VAKALAVRLGFIHIDTGAMYRALTWLALRQAIPLTDEKALSRLAQRAVIDFRQADAAEESQRIFCQGQDVTGMIRSQEVSHAVSRTAAIAGVRKALVKAQRRLAAEHDVVMDGRDIGTVVLPQADCKIFLTASVVERARRRWQEQANHGQSRTLEQIVQDIERRDYEDTHRISSPLRPAADSILLDSTALGFQDVVEKAFALVRSAQAG
jgi:cytidylate kinase